VIQNSLPRKSQSSPGQSVARTERTIQVPGHEVRSVSFTLIIVASSTLEILLALSSARRGRSRWDTTSLLSTYRSLYYGQFANLLIRELIIAQKHGVDCGQRRDNACAKMQLGPPRWSKAFWGASSWLSDCQSLYDQPVPLYHRHHRLGVAKARTIWTRPFPAPNYDLPPRGFLSCGTVGVVYIDRRPL